MIKKITNLALCLFTFSSLFAQNNVQFSVTDNWMGYMNVFQLPANGGWYEFGSAWALPDLKSSLNGANKTLVLQPNFSTYANGSTEEYWVDQTTLLGNKNMEAITFVEPGSSFNNQDLTFYGDVTSHTIDSAYTAYYFIKALDPNDGYLDALGGSKVFELPKSGSFSVTATAAELKPGLLIQYGFHIIGINANPAEESNLGNVTIGAGTTNTDSFEESNISISLSPNPAINQLSINSASKVKSYDIFNSSGQLMLSGKGENNIDISALTSGMYLFSAELAGGTRQAIRFLKE